MPTPTNEWSSTCDLVLANGLPKSFGSKDVSFPSKQNAKATAAKEAVLWLREQHKFPLADVKRPKVDPNNLPAGQTGLTQALKAFEMEPNEKVTQHMNRLVQSLGLHTPAYDLQASNFSSAQRGPAQGYWDVAVTFDGRDVAQIPKLGGRIGEVKHVYGKTKAKEACSQKVVQLLEEIELSRGLYE